MMSTAVIVKEFKFEAAHQLPNHDGHCARIHGHSYRVQVAIEGPIQTGSRNPKEGMVLDFGDLSKFWDKNIHSVLDHQFLNQVLGHIAAPTAEHIGLWIRDTIRGGLILPDGAFLKWVRVYETATSYAEV